MKRINITMRGNESLIPMTIDIGHPDGSFKDFEQVQIYGIDGDGNEVAGPEIRTVVLVRQPDENGIAIYEASIHR